MQLPSLQSATLIRRYKRFLADVQLPNGDITTLHCANTGAMIGCGAEGDTVWYSTSDSATRKYPSSWELTQLANGNMVCINTHRSNQLTFDALQKKQILELSMYDEVKSLTYVDTDKQLVMFPDAVTTRGQKHLRELIAMKKQGHRAVIFFCGLHDGFDHFQIAKHIDAKYDTLFQQALKEGVEAYAYAAEFEKTQGIPTALHLTKVVPLKLNGI